MKLKLSTIAAAVALSASSAFAQGAGPFIDAQSQDQYLARDNLIGAKVHGGDGKIVGDVEDIIVNDANQVVGVVMGTGGFFGVAEKKVGVTLSALKFEEKDGKMIVTLPDASPEAIAAAPAFQRIQPAKSLFERAREKALELSDKTKQSTQDAYDKAKPALDDAAAKAKETYDKAKEAAAPAVEKAKEAAQEAIDAAKNTVKTEETPAATPAPEPAPAPAAPEAPAPEAPAPTPAP